MIVPKRLLAILREPIVQFFAAGGVIFAIYAIASGPETTGANVIDISVREQAAMRAMFERTWKRPPNPDEFQYLIDGRIREEILSREAIALGLDQNDIVVRRRLAQKVEFLTDDLASLEDPDESDLADFLQANRDRFREGAAYSFLQIYLGPPDENLEQAMMEAQKELRSGTEPQQLGRPIELPMEIKAGELERIRRFFGNEFAAALADMEPGNWTGPVPSAYGVHLLKVTQVTPARLPELSEIRDAVERDWREDRRQKAKDAYYERIKANYEISIEQPDTDGAATAASAESGVTDGTAKGGS